MKKYWKYISYLGVENESGYETQRRIILLNRIAVSLFFIVFSLRITVIAIGFQDLTIQSFGPFIPMFAILLIPYLNKLGFYTVNSFTFSAIVPICFLIFSTLSQHANEVININHYYVPRIFIMVSLVLPLILIDTKQKKLLAIAIGINVLCSLFFDTVINYIGVPFDHHSISFNNYDSVSTVMLFPSALMILAFIFLTNLNKKYENQINDLNTSLKNKNNALEKNNYEMIVQKETIASKNSELEQANEEVTNQRDYIVDKNEELENAKFKIEVINKKLTDSIMYAENIQRAVMDAEQLPENCFNDSFIFFKPKSHVSGDFYYYKKTTLNYRECLIIAAVDCTGHGVPGGLLSMLGITLLNETILGKKAINAADILNQLRKSIKRTLNQKGKLLEQQDGMDMALCIYYPENKQMEYAGARNPLYIVDESNNFKIIKGDRQPIGIFLKEKPFTNHEFQFKGGEMVYIFSDGLQDQFGGIDGKKLKSNKFQKLLLQHADKTCKLQKMEIDSYLKKWITTIDNGEFEQIDDIVLIGMRI